MGKIRTIKCDYEKIRKELPRPCPNTTTSFCILTYSDSWCVSQLLSQAKLSILQWSLYFHRYFKTLRLQMNFLMYLLAHYMSPQICYNGLHHHNTQIKKQHRIPKPHISVKLMILFSALFKRCHSLLEKGSWRKA